MKANDRWRWPQDVQDHGPRFDDVRPAYKPPRRKFAREIGRGLWLFLGVGAVAHSFHAGATWSGWVLAIAGAAMLLIYHVGRTVP